MDKVILKFAGSHTGSKDNTNTSEWPENTKVKFIKAYLAWPAGL